MEQIPSAVDSFSPKAKLAVHPGHSPVLAVNDDEVDEGHLKSPTSGGSTGEGPGILLPQPYFPKTDAKPL